MSGDLALLRAFCQWKIEHQVQKYCVKGPILRRGQWLDAREMQAVCKKVVTSSSVAKLLGQILRLRATVFCSGHSLSKHKMTRYARNFFGGHGPLVYAYGYKRRIKYKEQYLLDVQSSTDKKLVTTQDRQTLQLQNSDEKQHCQYWMVLLVVTN